MLWFWVVLLAVVVVVGALVVRRRPRGQDAGPVSSLTVPRSRRPAVEGPWLGPVATIRLDVAVPDAETASAQRLVTSAAQRVLRTSPDVDEVIVEDRDGRTVAHVPRQAPTGPPPTRPEAAESHAPAHSSWREPPITPATWDTELAVERRLLADRLDLPEAVRARVRHPDEAVDVARAILETAGQPVEVTGSLVRSGDDVLIVVEDGGGGAGLSQAFLRFRDSGARRGIVVHLGHVSAKEVSRRRALAPQVLHAGTEVLQSMADAVALGGDPIQFAIAEAQGH